MRTGAGPEPMRVPLFRRARTISGHRLASAYLSFVHVDLDLLDDRPSALANYPLTCLRLQPGSPSGAFLVAIMSPAPGSYLVGQDSHLTAILCISIMSGQTRNRIQKKSTQRRDDFARELAEPRSGQVTLERSQPAGARAADAGDIFANGI